LVWVGGGFSGVGKIAAVGETAPLKVTSDALDSSIASLIMVGSNQYVLLAELFGNDFEGAEKNN